jgi:cyclic beta-1,2-glucan synthetase
MSLERSIAEPVAWCYNHIMFEQLSSIRDRVGRVLPRLWTGAVGGFLFHFDEPQAPWRATVLSKEAIAQAAQGVAHDHKNQKPRFGNNRLLRRYHQNRAVLERVYRRLSEAAQRGEPLTAGAEWLLDNYHVVERHAAAIRKYLPRGYYRKLPQLSKGELNGFPRVYEVALEVIMHSDAVVHAESASYFIREYQRGLELASGELWAFPIMLRFALLENLCRLTREAEIELLARREAFRVVDETLGDESRTGTEIMVDLAARLREKVDFFPFGALEMLKRLRARGRRAFLALQFLEEALRERGVQPDDVVRAEDHAQAARRISVGNTLTSLNSLDQVDWRSWFEEVSLVHQSLEREPTGIYALSDFETRDALRHRIEKISRRSKKKESEIARKLLELAERPASFQALEPPQAQLTNYFGYYLALDNGFPERVLGTSRGLQQALSHFVRTYAFSLYASAIAVMTIATILLFGWILGSREWRAFEILFTFLLALLPASELAQSLVQYIVTRSLKPKPLPKLDLKTFRPAEFKTIVLVHTIFKSASAVAATVENLEVRYLANSDEAYTFALMADLPDAKSEETVGDAAILDAASQAIQDLNARHPREGAPRFTLFFRHRLWNPNENRWMAWERKRGKIEELNRFLLGASDTTLQLLVGSAGQFSGVKYVVTLDSDSQLPRDSVSKLIATIAHPCNQAVVDPSTRRVVAGYGLIQPRVSMSLASASASRFAGLFAGPAGLDPYTNVVSEVYQDLFGEGSFVGKGIYDLRVFDEALHGRVPENALLSHDLFEGNFVRAGLASDIELFDDFPSRYVVFAKRLHRWVRGDWQVLPWLAPRVPSASGRVPNTMSNLGWWKLADNIRRSLLPVAAFLSLILSWCVLPGDAAVWTVFVLVVTAFPVLVGVASVFAVPAKGFSVGIMLEGLGRDLWRQFLRTLCAFCFIPHQAALMVHAVSVTVYRVFISGSNLLEWEPAEQSERRGRADHKYFTRFLVPALSVAAAALVLAYFRDPSALTVAIPVFIAWMLSPLLSRWLSSSSEPEQHVIDVPTRRYLMDSAHEIWRFFDDHLRPEYHYLMPDNLQLVPSYVVAERTSPTNVSLSMLAVISAYDLGLLPLTAVIDRVEKILTTMVSLEKYRGHLFNWYDIRTLAPLHPRYISSVDSGNLLGHAYVIDEFFRSISEIPLVRDDHLAFLDEIVHELATSERSEGPFGLALAHVKEILAQRNTVGIAEWVAHLAADRERFSQLEEFIPELARREQGLVRSVVTMLRGVADLAELTVSPEDTGIGSITFQRSTTHPWIDSVGRCRAFLQELIGRMDFGFLYDEGRELFAIGYNSESARRDGSYYDLLASEARLLSFVAVARGDVPQKHWFALGRSLASTKGGRALLSWSGTMFEYLMPQLVMMDYPTTILGRTARSVVRAQMAYGRKHNVPWGISESAYSGVDFEKTYQYRAFGVPGLGLKRGLSDDLVVSPYSTFLALPFAPSVKEAIDNLRALEKHGARGLYGFYESIDFTVGRVSSVEGSHVVQAFFAHHQGMSLVAIGNMLCGNLMVHRFHAQPLIKATELLLHERFPERMSAIIPHEPEVDARPRGMTPPEDPGLDVVRTPHSPTPKLSLLSNGRYSTILDSAGNGFSSFERSTLLTRWREDSTCGNYGTFVYVRDCDSGKFWSNSYLPTRVEPEFYEAIFSPGKVEYKRIDSELFVHTEVAVAYEDDVELRKITVTNLGDRKRIIELVSYAEPVVASRRADSAHPAFSKLFVHPEVIGADDAIIAVRRPRSHGEKVLCYFQRVTLRTSFAPVQFITSREEFIGRGRSLESPRALMEIRGGTPNSGTVGTDPVMALRVRLEIEGGAAEQAIFVAGVAPDRDGALKLITQYQELVHIHRAFELSWSTAHVEARNHAYSPGQLVRFNRLAAALLYNEPGVRGASDAISKNELGQSGLWRFGISGDLPIFLVKISNPRQVPVLQEQLLAHNYLRERGLEFDLVVLHHYPGGYMQQLAEELEFIVRSTPSGHLIDRPGGVFLRSSQQISPAEMSLLEAVSRVVLDSELGSLSELLDKTTSALPPVPATLSHSTKRAKTKPQSSTASTPGANLQVFNGVGGFAEDGRSYVMPGIGRSDPAAPWSNVVANPNFGFIVTERGGGFTWSENSRENRLTAWSNDPVEDPTSEAVFLRDVSSGNFWSLTPAPAAGESPYRVEHGFGFSRFTTVSYGYETELILSGSTNERIKWFGIKIANRSHEERRLEVYLYCEMVLGVTREDSYRHVRSSFDLTAQALCFQNSYNNEFAGRVVALGASEQITGYTASRTDFIGRNGTISNPRMLGGHEHGRGRPIMLSGTVGGGVDPCGVLQLVITLQPGESKEVAFYLKEDFSFDNVRREAERHASVNSMVAERERVIQWWRDLLGVVNIDTPSQAFNLMMNGWLLYQTVACRMFGRSGFYQSGGAIGFRDQLQDSLALLPIRPDLVAEQIVLHASRQFLHGDVQHWWHPPTGRGVRTKISDDLLWLPYAVARYVEVTGDMAIVDRQVPFLDGPELMPDQMENYFVPSRSSENATILEHCIRALRISAPVGQHGLPLIGCGDWNDGMNRVGHEGKGESVWLAWFLIECIQRFEPLLTARGQHQIATEFSNRSVDYKEALEAHGWDGEWYRRAYYDDGTPIGSKQSDECQIDSLPQSWSVIAGGGSHERAVQAVESGLRRLVDREANLIKVLTPPFAEGVKDPGYIKGYPPGIRENGGQYTHAATWMIIALAKLGRGDDAFGLFDLINPVNLTKNPEGVRRYCAEPYALCGDVYSEGNLAGRAGWSWYTGSSGWMFQAGFNHILGLLSEPDGFRVAPNLPKDWPSASVSYMRGGVKFVISFDNSSRRGSGVTFVRVNGVVVESNRIPWVSNGYGREVKVEVTI